MIQYSPHLSIGDGKDMYNILNGIFVGHEFDVVLDCSLPKTSRKWHKDKSIALKKISIDKANITNQKIRSVVDFISSMHKEHKNVLICSDKGTEIPNLMLFSFLLIKKGKGLSEAIDSVMDIQTHSSVFLPSVEFTENVLKLV